MVNKIKKKLTKQKENDIPKAVVVTLILLVMLISIVSTWKVLEITEKAEANSKTAVSSADGNVKLMLQEPSETKDKASVSLTVI